MFYTRWHRGCKLGPNKGRIAMQGKELVNYTTSSASFPLLASLLLSSFLNRAANTTAIAQLTIWSIPSCLDITVYEVFITVT